MQQKRKFTPEEARQYNEEIEALSRYLSQRRKAKRRKKNLEKRLMEIREEMKHPISAVGYSPINAPTNEISEGSASFTFRTADCELKIYEQADRAAKDLLAGRKSADVAAARGFDASSGFAKAFRRHYGLSPTQYRREMGDARFCVTPSIRPMGPFTAVGYRLAPPSGEFDVLDAGAYWMGKAFSFVSKDDYRRLAGPSPIEIGAWIQPDRETGAFFYFFGPVVEHTDFIPQGLVPVSFEAAEYAVFPVPAGNGNMTLLNENVRRMWKYIFQEWLPENGRYRAAGGRVDFECYQGGETSICIPVLPL